MASEAQHSTGHAADLTASQLLIWTGQQLQPGEPLYNMALTFRIEGAIDAEIFKRAFKVLVQCSDSLRSVIDTSGEVPRQRFLSRFVYDLDVVDLTGAADPEAAFEAWIGNQRTRSFDLSQCHFESSLIKLGNARFVWYLNQHHVLTDAWSVGVLFRKMSTLYGLAREDRLDEAEPLPRFEAYVEYEQAQRRMPLNDKAQVYWQQNLNRTLAPSRFYRPVPAGRTGRTVRLPCALGSDRTSQIKALASQGPFRSFSLDLSLFQFFCTALFAYLFRITGNRALAIGTPSHNRSSASWRETTGLFIEIFPMQIEVEPEETFVSLYKKVQRTAHELFLNAPPGASGFEHNRAYDVLLNYITASFGDFDGLATESEWVHAGFGDQNHLLRLQVHDFDRADEFQLFFDLNEDAFVGIERQWAVEHFLALIDGFVDNPDRQIAELSLLAPGDPYPLPAIGNAYRATTPAFVTVIEAFERQVRDTPDAVVLACGGDVLTYRELNAYANRLAHELSRRDIGPGAVAGVLMNRSIEAVVSIIGILKSGTAFLPIDPDYPELLIAFMLDDADVSLILTSEELRERVGVHAAETLAVSGDFLEALPDEADNRSPPTPDELAYIIYTSGSTGHPKGVLVAHSSVANYVTWAANTYLGGEALSFPLFSSLAFDLTITSVFVPLAAGGRIVVYPPAADRREIAIHRIIEDNEVDIIKLTPSHLALIESMDLVGSRIKKLILGGEDLRTDIARTITRRFGGDVEIYNEYGPTEATVGCMIYQFDPKRDTDTSVPIGRAIDNLRVYVLDDYAHPQPQGVTGELFIAGAGLSRGYLNREDVTHAKFVDDPFNPGNRMYATGDLARWNADGQMEYLGRKDEQVKIRGVRVELGEVEVALMEHEAITTCVVDLVERNNALPDTAYCTQCGLSAQHPDAHIDDRGVCRICCVYAEARDDADGYFRGLGDLKPVLAEARESSTGKQDCLMLLSGGKDSTYALCRLVDLGFTPLVFTLDNGFISDGAKANIRRVVDQLGLELVVGTTDAMNAIFVDSLNRFSNVCNGCFKTIYT